ncbi:RING-H2 finger protein ATL52-like [Oryza glaberrima]|uniref:RING-type domain-containing protein n=1 Tax=Oryza barthii TaxID=65489 RepID=A0A0D3GF79_9ORYZ|nr:RING-H2 finger protein ATL52-like [Oryza glaberrima]
MASPSSSSVISIFLLVAGVALMLVVHIIVVFWALRRGRGASRGEEEEAGRAAEGNGGGDRRGGGGKGLSADEIDALPCHDVVKGGGGGDCAVCLEALEAGDRCRRLPRCEHSFHAPCVDSWLRKSRWCPVCRADVVGRAPEGERKMAAAAGPAVETTVAGRSSSPATVEIVAER